MTLHSWFLLMLLLVTGIFSKGRNRRKPIIRIQYFTHCPGREHLNVISNFTRHVRSNGAIHFSLVDVVRKNTESLSKMEFVMTKCRDAVSFNTCEYYSTWSWPTGVCAFINVPNLPWSPIISAIHPPVGCPFKAGTYTVRNATFLSTQLVTAEAEGNVWKIDVHLYDQAKALCQCYQMAVDAVRSSA